MKKILKRDQKRFLKILRDAYPKVETELPKGTDFQLLLSILLSAQTTDKAVCKAMEPILRDNPLFGPRDLYEMGEENFYKKIEKIGLAPQKSRYAIGMAKQILEKHHGQIPDKYEDLVTLPGVGRKTALVFLNVAHGHATIPVDTHVERVTKRLGISKAKVSRLQVEKDLEKVVDREIKKEIHLVLVHHGRYTCKALKPLCDRCPLERECPRLGIKDQGSRGKEHHQTRKVVQSDTMRGSSD